MRAIRVLISTSSLRIYMKKIYEFFRCDFKLLLLLWISAYVEESLANSAVALEMCLFRIISHFEGFRSGSASIRDSLSQSNFVQFGNLWHQVLSLFHVDC